MAPSLPSKAEPIVGKKITNQGIFCSAARFRQANKLHRIVKCDRSKRNQRVFLQDKN
jgi:hypothetical protein